MVGNFKNNLNFTEEMDLLSPQPIQQYLHVANV